MAIRLFDFEREASAIGTKIKEAVERVYASGRFILDLQVSEFEQEFARFC